MARVTCYKVAPPFAFLQKTYSSISTTSRQKYLRFMTNWSGLLRLIQLGQGWRWSIMPLASKQVMPRLSPSYIDLSGIWFYFMQSLHTECCLIISKANNSEFRSLLFFSTIYVQENMIDLISTISCSLKSLSLMGTFFFTSTISSLNFFSSLLFRDISVFSITSTYQLVVNTRHLISLIFKNNFFLSLAMGLVKHVPKTWTQSPTRGRDISQYQTLRYQKVTSAVAVMSLIKNDTNFSYLIRDKTVPQAMILVSQGIVGIYQMLQQWRPAILRNYYMNANYYLEGQGKQKRDFIYIGADRQISLQLYNINPKLKNLLKKTPNNPLNKLQPTLMFCCTKKQTHHGQIVNTICLQQQCIKTKNQLMCPICIQQEHLGHTSTTMKKIIPELLAAHKDKERYANMLKSLLFFVVEHFGNENNQGEQVHLETLVDRAIEVMNQLKGQVQSNNQEILKMKDIFKNLNKNANQSSIPMVKSTIIPNSQSKEQQKFSPQKSALQSSPSKLSKASHLGSTMKSNQKHEYQSSSGSVCTFSHSLKHPYLALSPSCQTVTKSSHPGHRYSILGSKSLSRDQCQVHIKIDASSSGNIMIGLCHQTIVKQKDFVNSYGIGHGTYLIGQNGNHPDTAISFHHTTNIMNRKQIVGWNFKQNQVVTVGFNFIQRYIYFKLHKEKGKVLQFDMAILTEDYPHKESIQKLIEDSGLKIIVLLQNVGDQVTLIEA